MAPRTKRFVYDASRSGACCTEIHVQLAGETIVDVRIVDGCDGNHRGLEALVKGRPAREVVQLLLGTDCEGRGTSCPDQLARALQAALQTQ
jgi:uncharacterized protein (TIGR03905 family)